MLVISRKENESIRIEPIDGIDPSLTLREAFANGSIVVTLQHVGTRRVRLLIEAPLALRIIRSACASADGGEDAPTGAGAADLTAQDVERRLRR
jgi:sRNA-binding carbon storage regulator CsrA